MPFDAESMQKLVWLVLLLIFAASEAATVGLTSIWFAAGALAALIAALLGGALWIQITLFLAVTLLCLDAVRPPSRRPGNRNYVHSRPLSKEISFVREIRRI